MIYVITPLSSLSATVFADWEGSSVLLGNIIPADALRSLTTVLWLIAGTGILFTGIAIALASRFPHLWRPSAIGATLVGILSFAVFWDGQGAQFVNQGGIGLVLSVGILAGAIVPSTQPISKLLAKSKPESLGK